MTLGAKPALARAGGAGGGSFALFVTLNLFQGPLRIQAQVLMARDAGSEAVLAQPSSPRRGLVSRAHRGTGAPRSLFSTRST